MPSFECYHSLDKTFNLPFFSENHFLGSDQGREKKKVFISNINNYSNKIAFSQYYVWNDKESKRQFNKNIS